MELKDKLAVDAIMERWHTPEPIDPRKMGQAIFDIGYLCGLVDKMEEERKDLLARLKEATLPE